MVAVASLVHRELTQWTPPHGFEDIYLAHNHSNGAQPFCPFHDAILKPVFVRRQAGLNDSGQCEIWREPVFLDRTTIDERPPVWERCDSRVSGSTCTEAQDTNRLMTHSADTAPATLPITSRLPIGCRNWNITALVLPNHSMRPVAGTASPVNRNPFPHLYGRIESVPQPHARSAAPESRGPASGSRRRLHAR